MLKTLPWWCPKTTGTLEITQEISTREVRAGAGSKVQGQPETLLGEEVKRNGGKGEGP